MVITHEVIDADDRFFAALLQADSAALDRLLVDDFLLIDVNSGSEVAKALLVPAVGTGQLTFEAIEADGAARRVRRYGPAAVVTGRTRMRGHYAGAAWTADSRYTHVFVEEQGSWRMASAQGTPITAER
jgi:ketosteroid isomerase-like protein